MTLLELALGIDSMKRAIDVAFEVTVNVDDARLGRSGAAFVTDLKFTLDSYERALARRLEDGETE